MKKAFYLIFIASLVLNAYMIDKVGKVSQPSQAEEPGAESYPFLARRIFNENPNDIIINFTDLRQSLKEYTLGQKEKIGIYFEYLPNGNSIGINEKEPFFRASLVKVPAAMRAYKLIEERKLKKDDILTIKQAHVDPTYGELWKKGAGSQITVGEAIRLSLVESDNTAFEVLNEKVNSDILAADVGSERIVSNVYDFLDIPRVKVGPNQQITPKNFSSILKSLFFSAYLSYPNSNELLNLMSESIFEEGIRSVVPKEIKISHKFGIYNLDDEPLQVHSDCGIIYLPSRPYILCVMVNSPDLEKSGQYMAKISEIVYEYISK